MTTKHAERMEKVRKARSLNDIVAIVKDIAKDVAKRSAILPKMTATAAGKKPTAETLVIDHVGGGKSELKKRSAKKISIKKSTAPQVRGGHKIDFVVPSVGEIREHSATIHALEDNKHALEAAMSVISQVFSRSKNKDKALKAIQALEAELEDSLNNAYSVIQETAHKHIPEELSAMYQALFDYLIESIPNTQYKDISQHVFVTVNDRDVPAAAEAKKKGPSKIKIASDFNFACYIVINKLKTAHAGGKAKDNEGFVYDEYTFILTGVMSNIANKQGTLHFYLNGLPEFRPPGKYPLGAEVTSEDEMFHRASMLLAHNDVHAQFEKKPLPMDTKDAHTHGFHKIKNVSRVFVKEDELCVVVARGKESTANLHKIEVEVRSILTGVLGATKRKRSVILPRDTRNKSGETILRFRLIPNVADTDEQARYGVNATKLKELEEILDLSPEVVNDIKKVLKHHV